MKIPRTAALLLTLALISLSALVVVETGSARSPGSDTAISFSKDVAPVFFKNCAECHRAGEAAPFSLLTYKDARPWAKSIREKVIKREMPPWHADPHVGRFANDRRLTQAEIDTIVAWVDQGAKEGDPKDLPPAPRFADGWTIGKPDLVIPMPEEFTLEASGPDEYRNFETDPGFKQDVYVQQVEARPGNRKIVHHIIAFIKPPEGTDSAPPLSEEEKERKRAEEERDSIEYKEGFLGRTKADAPVHDDGCVLPNGGAGQRRDARDDKGDINWLVVFAPGTPPARLAAGTAVRIPAGSKILFQMHYSKAAGSVQKDRSMVGLVFAKQPPEKEVLVRAVFNRYFHIPPGAQNYKVTACWSVPEDIHFVNFMPHMHLRGRSQKIEAFYPDGRRETLLDVPNYDFSWQTVYYLTQPTALPKGTKILVTSTFDNSARNKNNPDPTKAVRWGGPTYDEMMIGFISYTKDGQKLPVTAAVKGGGPEE